ncbi:alpha/beta hydrolase [Amycolatopsis sp. NPDC051061]|uniref:alpha/beta hydrolase n=1 Tax=Amycolatopsis sp. NPDC051061 TaxID=3155042 RepID=UPI00343EB3A0
MRLSLSRRAGAFAGVAAVLLVLSTVIFWPDGTPRVPPGATPDSLTVRPCTFDTEAGARPADCGTLVVAENRANPASNLIALPVIRIRATAQPTGEPIFRLGGGPGLSNMDFPEAARLTDHHDVVLVGYRGVDGSRRLDCPEVTSALQSSEGMTGPDALPVTSRAFGQCANRLRRSGVDLTGYSVVQRVEDMESARKALGYPRIDLVSSSAGTRTAMVYGWRHPEALLRSAMISVNPPGHLFWDPRTTDSQFAQYAELCRADAACAAKTPDLAAAIRDAVATMPPSWGPLAIKNTNVRILSQYAMHYNGGGSAPSNAPTAIDAYLDGGPGAMWAMSVLADLALPTSTVWGEFASFSMIDAPATQQYYAQGGDPGSILGNASTDFLWGGPAGFSTAWPDSPDNAEYRTVRPSSVETLLVGGELDFSTPPVNATKELLPALSRGQQVILPGLGHTNDFWEHRPEAGEHLLTTFFDTGRVDSSQFDRRPVDFDAVPLSMPTIAGLLVGVTTGGALLGLLVLGLLVRKRLRRGAPGRRASRWIRALIVIPLGLAGWFLGVLFAWTLAPGWFIAGPTVVVPGAGLLIGLGAYLARSTTRSGSRFGGAAATVAGALVGAWLAALAGTGLVLPAVAIVGAALGANLVLALSGRRRHVEMAAPAAAG